ncbi:GDSL-type esterase/lipase family protein [Actinomyces qiguomingii]|uniref:GDSL-type esterase/lipase family protein n=1 Tax=Actinomyces qiguomingii TaxID=2057800 RepID=UPI000CA068CC|nr:GDSL-type esterase/lipase family protein [Actinomyces qiguomingii]
MDDVSLCFVGDELVSGYGDARALGWTGRVMARTPRELDIMWNTLAVPGETTAQLAERWQGEVARRSTHTGLNRLVIGVGVGDVLAGVSPARSRLAIANVLDAASGEHRSCFVVGPPPLPSADPDGTAALSRAVGEVCQRRGIPFVETFEPLRNHDQWLTDVVPDGGTHPGQTGYGLLAWLVLHRGWYEWLGVSAPR